MVRPWAMRVMVRDTCSPVMTTLSPASDIKKHRPVVGGAAVLDVHHECPFPVSRDLD
jgi:hypothetical protein